MAAHGAHAAAVSSNHSIGAAGQAVALNSSANSSLVNGTRFIDVEEDRIEPGWAVLLMYLMLVSCPGRACSGAGGSLQRQQQLSAARCCRRLSPLPPSVHDLGRADGAGNVAQGAQEVVRPGGLCVGAPQQQQQGLLRAAPPRLLPGGAHVHPHAQLLR